MMNEHLKNYNKIEIEQLIEVLDIQARDTDDPYVGEVLTEASDVIKLLLAVFDELKQLLREALEPPAIMKEHVEVDLENE